MKFVLALAILAATVLAASQERSVTPDVLMPGATGATMPLLRLSGPIGPATADFITRGLKKAAQNRALLVVLQLDTPGGLDSSTRQIVEDILASPLPVAGWVAPGGARAASAGAYTVYASHIAAMAPGTNLGAARPVQIGGLPGTPAPGARPHGADERRRPAHCG